MQANIQMHGRLFTCRENAGMAGWAFICKHYQLVFMYSRTGETFADFIAEDKPKLPRDGVECICPHCKTKGTYRRYELRLWNLFPWRCTDGR